MNQVKKPMVSVKPKPLMNLSDAEKADLERRKQAIASVQDDDVVSRTTIVMKKSLFKRYKQFLLNEDLTMKAHLEELLESHLNEYEAKKGE